MPWTKIGRRAFAGNLVPLGIATLSFSTTVALGAGSRNLSFIGIEGLASGDRALFIPDAIPAGYSVGMAIVTGAKTITVPVSFPALVVGANFTIPGRVYAIR